MARINDFIDTVKCYSFEVIAGGMVIGMIAIPITLNLTVFSKYKYVQVCDEYSNVNDDDVIMNNNGEYVKEFEEGEHVIKVSKYGGYKQHYEDVDGYTIQSVEFIPSRYHSEAIYVNDCDVVAVGEVNNNYVEFDSFGEVQEKHR